MSKTILAWPLMVVVGWLATKLLERFEEYLAEVDFDFEADYE